MPPFGHLAPDRVPLGPARDGHRGLDRRPVLAAARHVHGHATAIAGGFWTVSLVGFVAAALGMAGVAGPTDAWRTAAVVVVLLAGIGLLLGTWPAFNTVAAILVNVAILAAVVVGR